MRRQAGRYTRCGGHILDEYTAGALIDPLAQQIDDAVLNIGRMPAVMNRLHQASDQPALPFDTA